MHAEGHPCLVCALGDVKSGALEVETVEVLLLFCISCPRFVTVEEGAKGTSIAYPNGVLGEHTVLPPLMTSLHMTATAFLMRLLISKSSDNSLVMVDPR